MMRTSGAQNFQARQHDLRENAAGELERFPLVRCFADHLHLVLGDDTRDASRRMPHGTQGEWVGPSGWRYDLHGLGA